MLELVPLRGEYSETTTNLLEILFKILDKHLLPFYVGVPPGESAFLGSLTSFPSHAAVVLHCTITVRS